MKNSWNISVPSLQDIFDTSFRHKEWNWFLQIVNAIPERDLAVLNFAYLLPKRWADLFSHVNDKQPI